MARLSDEELNELLVRNNPDQRVDQSLPPQPKQAPPTARTTADRAKLAEKVRQNRGIASDAPAPEPEELHDDEAQITTLTVTGPDGTPRRKGAIVDTHTGKIIAEQG
ncbi:hypothetical protein Mycsm_06545 (plasmid) [Mycobacterium sp. JS623]|uniref:hypothetical protein n=1 Tax=Mycobacterium sp. JS623 TaxID=212767 RepID=UPI0002A589F8|nr:hypothetical protein [Mycobacterium sp. JS623]AGB26682.1 hypothetical protein Mycsm_06545 [Mycobacterium sp. JS623]